MDRYEGARNAYSHVKSEKVGSDVNAMNHILGAGVPSPRLKLPIMQAAAAATPKPLLSSMFTSHFHHFSFFSFFLSVHISFSASIISFNLSFPTIPSVPVDRSPL